MKRAELPPQASALLAAVRELVDQLEIDGVLLMPERPYDFGPILEGLRRKNASLPVFITASKPNVIEAAAEDGLDVIDPPDEPQSRRIQLTQAVLEAVADGLLPSRGRVAALFASFERENLDTLSILNLSEQLTKLTSRDLQRLETQVPLDILRRVIDLAVEIGRDGREGKPVGTIFVVGDHRRVLELSHEQIHDPFRGYTKKERMIRSARVRESVKELAQIDGAFVVSADGAVMAAGRILNPAAEEVGLSMGLGARHHAAAGISKSTKAIAVAVSESTGSVRVFEDGRVVLRIEPMDQAMTWDEASEVVPES